MILLIFIGSFLCARVEDEKHHMFHDVSNIVNIQELRQSAIFRREMELAEQWPALKPDHKRSRDYRKEVERFVLWCLQGKRTLRCITAADATAYRTFLSALSQSSSMWVASPPRPRLKDGKLNPEWRPFAGALKASSIKQAGAILHGFYEFLVAKGSCADNPWKREGRAERRPSEVEKLHAPQRLFASVFEFCRSRCLSAGDVGHKVAIRDLWILALVYLTGTTIADLLPLRMSSLYRNEAGWWLELSVVGSGEVATPFGPDLLALMKRYRRAMGLPSLPSPGESDVPLVGDARSGRRHLTSSAAYKIARDVFRGASFKSTDAEIAAELFCLTPTRFCFYSLQCLREHLALSAEPSAYWHGLRGAPSLELMRLSLRHPLPNSSN
jgi:integrase/recombinase XerD